MTWPEAGKAGLWIHTEVDYMTLTGRRARHFFALKTPSGAEFERGK